MSTHKAVATIGRKQPLGLIDVPTVSPSGDEVRIHVEWTASTPLDLHQNDGGLLVQHPQILGDGTAGTVVEVGDGVKRLKAGDKVFGFTWRRQKEKAHQEFCTAPEWLLAKLPDGFTLEEAVTLPNNFVTVFHSVTADLGIELPWPRPKSYKAQHAEEAILIWGGSSSVGQYAIQILKYYGYSNMIATASKKHHEKLKKMGAKWTFDYNDPHIVRHILTSGESRVAAGGHVDIPFILDCIGSKTGSITPISKVAQPGSKVAILLPVIVKDSTEAGDPEYEMDVHRAADWHEGVDVRGVRTHHHLENEFFKHHLQPDIMPMMLKEGIVEPNNQRIITGETMLERAQNALDALRRKEASGERLVWRVADAMK